MPQLPLFSDLPQGLRLVEDVVEPDDEVALLALQSALPMAPYVLRGQASLRRVGFFGAAYDGLERPALPSALEILRDRVCGKLGVDPAPFVQALYSWYPPGAGIGWHVDRASFGPVVLGVSLGAGCRLKLRRGAETREVWLPPRSLYVLGGEARVSWAHHLPPVGEERVSVTFRTMRGE